MRAFGSKNIYWTTGPVRSSEDVPLAKNKMLDMTKVDYWLDEYLMVLLINLKYVAEEQTLT